MIRIVAAALSLVALVVVIAVFAMKLHRIPTARGGRAMLIPLSQIALVGFLLAYLIVYDLPTWLFALAIAVSIVCGVADIALFKALLAAEEKDLAEERERILEEQMVTQRGYRNELSSAIDDAQRERLRIVEELKKAEKLLACGDVEASTLDMTSVAEAIEPAKRLCSHPAVAALLAAKQRLCDEKGIAASFKVVVPESLDIPSVDICAVFSNLMDNAIHACEQMTFGKRFVDVKANVSGGFVVVKVKNSCNECPSEGAKAKKRENAPSELLREHGWGLVILQAIAERYRGSCITEQEPGVFRTTVMLEPSE